MLNLVTDGDLQIDGLRMGLGVPADLNKDVTQLLPSIIRLASADPQACIGAGRPDTSSAFMKGA